MRFEDLEVWQRATGLAVEVLKGTRELKDYAFRDQIARSSLSVPSNIAEGFERESIRECVNFLSYAKGSCGELRTQIHIGVEVGYLPRDRGQTWVQECREVSSMIAALIATRRRFSGPTR